MGSRTAVIGKISSPSEETMNRNWIPMAVAGALAAAALAAHAEDRVYRVDSDYAHPIRHAPDWNVAAADGMCRLHIWVDDRARVKLQGDRIEVVTRSGKRSYDQGSACTQPLPAHAVDNFHVVVERGRGTVMEARGPENRNGYTGSVTVVDPQDGGDSYDLVMAWHNPGVIVGEASTPSVVVGNTPPPDVVVGNTPAPEVVVPNTPPPPMADNAPLGDYTYVDEVRACQDRVRAKFQKRNPDGDAYLDFDTSTRTEHIVGLPREHIRGGALARNRTEDRRIDYRCTVDHDEQRVISASYDVQRPRRVSSIQ